MFFFIFKYLLIIIIYTITDVQESMTLKLMQMWD